MDEWITLRTGKKLNLGNFGKKSWTRHWNLCTMQLANSTRVIFCKFPYFFCLKYLTERQFGINHVLIHIQPNFFLILVKWHTIPNLPLIFWSPSVSFAMRVELAARPNISRWSTPSLKIFVSWEALFAPPPICKTFRDMFFQRFIKLKKAFSADIWIKKLHSRHAN